MNLAAKLRRWPQLIRRRIKHTTTVRLNYYSRPAFIIIGVQRGGTTSLHRWLTTHPQIRPGDKKEVHYFDLHPTRGHDWYHSLFPLPVELGRDGITFESTPMYFYHPAVPARIHEYDPAMKLVVILRDPVERAISQWHLSQAGYNRLGLYTFEETIAHQLAAIESDGPFNMQQSPTNLVDRGFYYDQFVRYFGFFDRSQILICEHEELKQHPAALLDRIIAFAGLRPYQWDTGQFSIWNRTAEKTQIDSRTRDLLREYYKDHNRRLFGLLGHEYDWQ